jgi:hypothetical protein
MDAEVPRRRVAWKWRDQYPPEVRVTAVVAEGMHDTAYGSNLFIVGTDTQPFFERSAHLSAPVFGRKREWRSRSLLDSIRYEGMRAIRSFISLNIRIGPSIRWRPWGYLNSEPSVLFRK